MNKLKRYAAPAVALVAIAGCGGNAASPPEATTVVSPSSARAQVVVGTANIFGSSTGLNVVSTMRTPQGKSVLVSTPTLTGPYTLPAPGITAQNAAQAALVGANATVLTGPAPGETAISGHPQVAPGTPSSGYGQTTFGIKGGLFANGFFPANATNLGTVYDTPYPVPLYDPLNVGALGGIIDDPNGFTPWGGPPAFDPNHNGEGTRDGTFDPSILGVSEGITVFEGVIPRAGTYTMGVIIPSVNGNTPISASTTVSALPVLPNVVAPTYVPDGLGGGTFAVVLPAGVTSGLVQITDSGAPDGGLNCHLGHIGTAYYTIAVSGSGTAVLPDSDGPRTATAPFATTPTICTAAQNAAAGNTTGGDAISVTLIGADYPLYASNYLFNLTTQLPAISGPNGTDDITISPALTSAATATRIRRIK